MKNYLDERLLVIKEYASLFDDKDLTSITVFDLPTGDNVDLDEVYCEIEKITLGKIHDGFEIIDTRYRFERGSSQYGQEIILSAIGSIVGTGFIFVVKSLWSWAKKQSKSNTREQSEFSLNDSLQKIKKIISEHFRTVGKLQVMRLSGKLGSNRCHLKDGKNNLFEAEFSEGGRIIKIQKLKLSRSKNTRKKLRS